MDSLVMELGCMGLIQGRIQLEVLSNSNEEDVTPRVTVWEEA